MSFPRASSVSRQIKAGWDYYPFPIVKQMGDDLVLVEGQPHALGMAASALVRADYSVTFDGQWLVDGTFRNWLEVRRP
jgi:hypothetical protein